MENKRKKLSLIFTLALFIVSWAIINGTSKIPMLRNKDVVQVSEKFIRDSFQFKEEKKFLDKKAYLNNYKNIRFRNDYDNKQNKLFKKYKIKNKLKVYNENPIVPFPDYKLIEWEVESLKIKEVEKITDYQFKVKFDVSLNINMFYDPSNSGDISALFKTEQKNTSHKFKNLTLNVYRNGKNFEFEVPSETGDIVNEFNLTWQKDKNSNILKGFNNE